MKKYLSSYPELVKEWHPTKNGDLTPKDVTHGSEKKAWWLCPKGHSYETRIYSRTGKIKNGCPYCSGRRASGNNNLEKKFPKIAREWHPTKNKDLTPRDVTPNSAKKVWWLCSNGHSFEAIITNRSRWGKGKCPYCLRRTIGNDNNLLHLFPDLAKEWHPTKNKELKPNNFVPGSRQKIWWICPKGHSYETSIQHRTKKDNPTGCPNCTNQSSQPEIRILAELNWFFKDTKHRYKFDNLEIDIFLPNLNIGIEYDGKYWHRGIEEIDLKKNQLLSSNGVYLIRVRQKPLKALNKNDVIVGHSFYKKDMNEILKLIHPFADKNTKDEIDKYICKQTFINEELFKKYRSYFPSPFPENSLLATHPELCKEWDYDKNYPLRPENFSYGSHQHVWWICSKGHSNKSIIQGRARKKKPLGCPYCSGRKTLNYDLFK